jgi:cell wall integrity and stress response component
VGAIVGGVLGGIAFLAAIVGAVLFVLWRRRRQREEAEDGQFGVQRKTSTISKSGLLRTAEKPPQFPPTIVTSLKRNSRMTNGDSISPTSGSERRNSRPYLFDQRLNPSAIMTMENASRGSFVSMDDSRDYGRTLNVRRLHLILSQPVANLA